MTALPSLDAISQVGGFVFAVFVSGAIILGLIHGDLVPGWLHKREIDRADKATDLLSDMTASMDRNTKVLDIVVGQQTALLGRR